MPVDVVANSLPPPAGESLRPSSATWYPATSGGPTIDSVTTSRSFQLAELRSECARVTALLGVFASLLALTLIRGLVSIMHGHTGAAWPFALLLTGMTAYELQWRRLVQRAIRLNLNFSTRAWATNILIESLLPTVALFLEVHTSFIGPERALTSPVILAYFLFIVLSTLHLSSQLSRLSGIFAATGYAAVSIYVFTLFPQAASDRPLLGYSTAFAYAALMLVGGFAAGTVARQIRWHVIAGLEEASNRAKLEQDLSIARTIQQGLLPRTPPAIEGFDIAGWNQPADQTGGDYFDWQELPDGRIAVTIADVTGHGIGSALGMAGCRAYARAGLAAEKDLRRFLSGLNALLYADLPPEKFVTLATGVLNPKDAAFELISAGHGPLLFYSHADDSFTVYDAQGPPLGLLPRFPYGEAHRFRFLPGDILVFVTDGILEWANRDDEEFGQARLEHVIRACAHLPAARIISEMNSAVIAFAAATPQLDDLTALVLKRT